jgi:hypothetical protein
VQSIRRSAIGRSAMQSEESIGRSAINQKKSIGGSAMQSEESIGRNTINQKKCNRENCKSCNQKNQ